MNWSQLTKSDIDEFLQIYNINGQSLPLEEAINIAQKLFAQISETNGQVTEAIRDLYIASSLKNILESKLSNLLQLYI